MTVFARLRMLRPDLTPRRDRRKDPARARYPLAVPLLVLLSACRPTPPASPPAADATPPADRDGDGWYDLLDRCPGDPGAIQGCPADPDPDRDNVLGLADRCPLAPAAQPDGCPPPDTDRDGILDPDDACPTEPENHNQVADRDGCPEVVPLATTYLDVRKQLDNTRSRPVLDQIAAVLRASPEVKVEIVCHESKEPNTRHYGPAVAKLTLRRANTLKQYLVRVGIAAERIKTRGAGWDEPVDTNEDAPSRAMNRRCEYLPWASDR